MKILMSTILMILAISAYGQEPQHLDVSTVVQKEETFTNDAGEIQTRLVTAESVTPGETVFYTITFKNIGDESADKVVITNPIADSLVYVDGSAFGPGTDIEFSVDGGKTYGKPDELTVEEGGETRAAENKDFTHVRWVMQGNLAAGAQGTARFAAVLE